MEKRHGNNDGKENERGVWGGIGKGRKEMKNRIEYSSRRMAAKS